MTAGYAFEHDPAERIREAIAAGLRAMSGQGPGGHGKHRRGPRHRGADFFFGPGPFGFGGPPFRGRKARRGDVRAAALVLLYDEPRNGYQLMQEIERRSEGAWRPSPGSIYPALQQLEDEGLVNTTGEERRLYQLTDAGRSYVDENRAELGEPWEEFSRDVGDEWRELAGLLKDVAFAATQVLRAGDEAQIGRAEKVLADAKKALYLILADEGGEPTEA